MAGKCERMKELIDKIEKYDFECKAGFLEECEEWIELKKEVNNLETEPAKDVNYIERMEFELQELEEKIEKLTVFLEKENEKPKYTDDIQRILLENQKEHMKSYARILKHRIHYDTLKAHGEKPCYIGNNYDKIGENCIK